VVRGACAVVSQAEAPLPEPVAPAPADDAPLAEILATEAAAIAEAADPTVLETARREARGLALVADLDGVIARNPLDETTLMLGLSPAKEHERPSALARRAARCDGSAARLRAYLRADWHPRHAELVDLHARLDAEGDRLMTESRRLA